jgi:protein-S-isoprenylcysteine O-methyltransferase Ste14
MSVSAVSLFSRLLLLAMVLAGLLFLPAGRLDWLEAWLFILAFTCFLILYAIRVLRHDPAQLQERGKTAQNVKSWDKAILSLYTGLLILLFPVCALDAGRFHVGAMPKTAEALGWLGLACAGGIILWAAASNTFLSRRARIQNDRGQTVVSAGPYQFVRHPMYLGVIVLFLGIPLALGSFWGLIPGILIGILFIIRTALEDRMLRAELVGYGDYAKRVRFRIVPRIW